MKEASQHALKTTAVLSMADTCSQKQKLKESFSTRKVQFLFLTSVHPSWKSYQTKYDISDVTYHSYRNYDVEKKSHRLLKIVIDTLKKICECEGVREGSSGWLHVLMSRGLRTQVHRSIPVCLVVKYSTVHIPLFSSKQREQQDNKNKSIYWNTRCCVRFYLVYLINHRNTVQKHLKFLSLGSQ